MSYIPGTKLSSFDTNLHATVLTDAKVMMTHGLGAGQIVKLEDWLILAGDNITVFSSPQVQAVQAPVETPVETPVQLTPVQVQEPVEAPAQVQEKVAIFSKFRWTLCGGNYRVAIMTSKGLLQVKCVIDDITSKDSIGRVKTTMFADEAAWRASLPEGDAVIQVTSPDNRTDVEKRIQRAEISGRYTDDAGKLNEFMDRFKIRSDFFHATSPNKMVETSLGHIEFYRNQLNKITLEEDLAGSKRHPYTIGLKRALRNYNHYKYRASLATNPNLGTPHLYVRGTNRLRTNIGGTEYEVGLKGDRIMATQIAIRPVSSKHSPAILYNNLAEMGNPKIYMMYRRRRIDLPV